MFIPDGLDFCTILHKIVAKVDSIDYDINYHQILFDYRSILSYLEMAAFFVHADDHQPHEIEWLINRADTLTKYVFTCIEFDLDLDDIEFDMMCEASGHVKRVGINADNYVNFNQYFRADVKTFAEHHLSKIANELLWSWKEVVGEFCLTFPLLKLLEGSMTIKFSLKFIK